MSAPADAENAPSSKLPPLEKYVALDCESVRARAGQVLARVGMVDYKGDVILESYVFVHPANVVDWLTNKERAEPIVHGIKPGDLDGAPTFEKIQPRIKALLKDKILVGHALWNDLAWINHRHPYEDMRDTSLYYPLRKLLNVEREGDQGSLKKLAKEVLGQDVQTGFHCPVEDARTAMAIFMKVREQYETELLEGKECISGLPRSHSQWYW